MKRTTFLNTLFLSACLLINAWGVAQTTYTFANYPQGAQYAINEPHVLDADVTVYTTECWFYPPDLRIYSSGTHNGFFLTNELPYYIDSLAFNVGDNADQLAIFGSNDSLTWTQIGTIAVTSAYTNRGLSFGSANYKRFKVDVVGSNQLRLKNMTIYYKTAVATPTITPAAGLYYAPQNITLNCDTAGATIRYTLDGTNPTSASTTYTSPFLLSTSATVKARAWKGLDSSAVATATYTLSLTPTLSVSPTDLLVYDTATSTTFTVTAANLASAISITSDNPDFQVNPSSLPITTTSGTVNVTFTGSTNDVGKIIVTSGTLRDSVFVTGEIYVAPIDTIIYGTGFEANEGFAIQLSGTAPNYQNDTLFYTGGTNEKWRFYHGTPTTTSAITGVQSAQTRYYVSGEHNGHIGYTFTDFDLHNVTKVTFKAKRDNVPALQLKAQYSVDGGYSWIGDSSFVINTTAADFTYFITDSGQYYNVRLKFSMDFTTPIAAQLTIDDVTVYGVLGLEPTIVATPTISPNSGNHYTAQTVTIACETENAEIRYTIDGSEPTITSQLYTSFFTIDSTTVVKAKGFKAGYDASNTATATYTFPIKVPNIAAWKAANTANSTTPYTITGDITFVFKNGSNIYVQDNTGGMLIYDNTSIISETYSEGDVISGGITGKCEIYNGMRELIPLLNPAASTVNNGTVAPTVVTAATLASVSGYDEYEARLVRINNITFEEDGVFDITTATNVNFSQNATTLIARNSFKTLDMTIEEGTTADIIGFVAKFNTDVQLYPRNNDDIIIITETVDIPYFLIDNVFYGDGSTYTIFTVKGGITDIVIGCGTVGATIYYTEDNSEPTTASTLYTEPFEINPLSPAIKAIAVKEGMITSAVSTLYIVVEGGIDDINQDLVTLYPNPAQSFVKLDNLLEVQAQAIALYNAQGQLIGKYAVTDNIAEISLSGMASGTYFVQIATPKGNIVKKISKN